MAGGLGQQSAEGPAQSRRDRAQDPRHPERRPESRAEVQNHRHAAALRGPMSILAFILASALLGAQEETVTSGNVVVRLPAGWKTEHKPEGLFLTPGDLQEDQSYVVIVS